MTEEIWRLAWPSCRALTWGRCRSPRRWKGRSVPAQGGGPTCRPRHRADLGARAV